MPKFNTPRELELKMKLSEERERRLEKDIQREREKRETFRVKLREAQRRVP